METNIVKSQLISFAGKSIPRERVVSFWMEKHKTFPYIDWGSPLCWRLTKQFPFYRRYVFSDSFVNWKTKHCIALELDTGKVLREWYYDNIPIGYCSNVNCKSALDEFRWNYYK